MEVEESPSDDGSIDKMRGPSKRERLRGLTSRTKTNTKRLLNLEKPHDHDDGADRHDDDVLDDINADPAFNPSKLIKKKRLTIGGAAGKALGSIQTVAETVTHPIESIKSKATRTTAGNLSQAERPYLSQKADLEFLKAHVNLSRAKSSRSSRHNTSDDEQDPVEDEFREKVEELEAHRESLRVAWTTSRHIGRVRVVPKEHMDFPDDQAFLEKDDRGNVVRYKWEKWLGYVSNTRMGLFLDRLS